MNNSNARAVRKQLADWRFAIDRFERGIARGLVTVRDDIAEHIAVDGHVELTPLAEFRAWKAQVATLEAEAKRREAAGDAEWFRWIDQYGRMVRITLWDDVADRYTRLIDGGSKRLRSLARGPAAAAAKRQEKAERRRSKMTSTGKPSRVSDRTIRRDLRGK